jgi:hypothetical protein
MNGRLWRRAARGAREKFLFALKKPGKRVDLEQKK